MIRLRTSIATAIQEVSTNPTLAAVSAEGFLTRLGFSMIGFALPLFALSLGMSIAEVGLLYALRTATTVVIKPAMGWAADRFGRKPTLIAAVVLRCVTGLLFVFAFLPWHLYAIRILHGAMTAARDPSAAALISEHGNRRSMASAFAWYSTARDVGRSCGYAVAGLLIYTSGSYQGVFVIAFLTSCVALVTVIRYVRERPLVAPGERLKMATGQSPVADSSWGRYRALLPYAGFGLMVAGSAEMMAGFFPVIATQYAQLTEAQAGIAVSLSGIASLVAGPLFGWLSDNVNRKLALSVRSAANTLSSLMYIFLPTFTGFVVARVLDDTGKAAFRPTWGAIMADVAEADPARRARTITFIDSAQTLGEVIGPLAAGLLMGAFGVPVMLGVRAALALLTEIHAVRVFKHATTGTPARLRQH